MVEDLKFGGGSKKWRRNEKGEQKIKVKKSKLLDELRVGRETS